MYLRQDLRAHCWSNVTDRAKAMLSARHRQPHFIDRILEVREQTLKTDHLPLGATDLVTGKLLRDYCLMASIGVVAVDDAVKAPTVGSIPASEDQSRSASSRR